MKETIVTVLLASLTSVLSLSCAPGINTQPISDEVRARQVRDLKFGMFICWSFSTFSGREWTRGVQDVNFFKATGCDTDQWCKVAKDAGMNYILFLTKHHDGFCLWDTNTTDWKVTKSPLRINVLAKLTKSCDKHGIKLALYFSEGDWTWPKNRWRIEPRGDRQVGPLISAKLLCGFQHRSNCRQAQLKGEGSPWPNWRSFHGVERAPY